MQAKSFATVAVVALFVGSAADAAPFFFTTGSPDGLIATASRPSSAGKIEIESADDFILADETKINSATFTGLIPIGASLADIGQVRVEIYRVFPKDSTVPPSGNVPTRANSPSDIAFADRDSAAAGLTYSTAILNATFSANNSVVNGINKIPNQTTGGEGPVRGQEVQFTVNFATPFDLPADHYFFIPQVELNAPGDFLWLSAPKPTTPPFVPDLQSWIRNENLDPDWLRIGTDVVGSGAFNASFSLSGEMTSAVGPSVPLPPAVWTGFLTAVGLGLARMRRRGV